MPSCQLRNIVASRLRNPASRGDISCARLSRGQPPRTNSGRTNPRTMPIKASIGSLHFCRGRNHWPRLSGPMISSTMAYPSTSLLLKWWYNAPLVTLALARMAFSPALWNPDRYTSRKAACSRRSRVRFGFRNLAVRRSVCFAFSSIPTSMYLKPIAIVKRPVQLPSSGRDVQKGEIHRRVASSNLARGANLFNWLVSRRTRHFLAFWALGLGTTSGPLLTGVLRAGSQQWTASPCAREASRSCRHACIATDPAAARTCGSDGREYVRGSSS